MMLSKNAVSPTTLRLRDNGWVPNNPALPILIYRKVLESNAANKHKLLQQCFGESGWKGIWKNGLYDYHHFHPSSHEVLGIANGTADVMLGGENGETVILEAGDVIVLPAGTGHKRLASTDGLVVIGAYPPGQENYSVCHTGTDNKNEIAEMISKTPLPSTDPIYGDTGPLRQLWNS